jgi:dihydroorotase
VEHGKFGFVDMRNTKLIGTEKLICQMTIKDGKVVYDLNGLSAEPWDATAASKNPGIKEQ